MTDPLVPTWFDALKEPETYPHPVSEIQFAETHISWVVLTGEWVYKLKKPVNFGFVNFTTLERRRIACLDEVRLNRRTAPDLYDRVVPLTKDASGVRFEGTGAHLEYAVRMCQFPREDTFDCILARRQLTADTVESLARSVAELHQTADIATGDSSYGEPSSIFKVVDDCFEVLRRDNFAEHVQQQLHELSEWIQTTWRALHSTFLARQRGGYVRECHGDLHLGNVVLYRGKPTLFDGLEFNADLRWIDIASDIAFLVMDLCDRDATALGWRAFNEWLQQTGDYGALRILKYYMVYRALVRAKVANLRLRQAGVSSADRRQYEELLRGYLDLASTLSQPGQPAIVLMHGVSGSGKSQIARQLAASWGAIHIRSDVERKRLFGIWPVKRSEPAIPPSDLYGTLATERTHRRLQSLASDAVSAQYQVIVDATFLKRSQRQTFYELAEQLRVPLSIVSCQATDEVLRDRVVQRQQAGRDASDADLKVLESQLAQSDPITDEESQRQVAINTASNDVPSLEGLRQQIEAVIRR